MQKTKSSGAQTFVAPIANTGTQTRARSNSASQPGDLSGSVDALVRAAKADSTDDVLALVGDDVVVDYVDAEDEDDEQRRAACQGTTSEDAVTSGGETEDEEVYFGKVTVLLPKQRADFVPSGKAASPLGRCAEVSPERESSEQSTAELDEAARTIHRLKRELDELRTTSTLRERELNSIVDSCRVAIKAEFQREYKKREEDSRRSIEALERNVQQLKDIIAKRDETIREKLALLQQHAEIVDEAKRERDRTWMVVEGNLKSELAKLRLEKEKLRFGAEVAGHRNDTAAAGLATLEQRAHAAEQAWHAAALRQLSNAEELARQSVANEAELAAMAVSVAARQLQRLDDYHTIRSEERWSSIYEMLLEALQYNGEEGLERLRELQLKRGRRHLSPHRTVDTALDADITLSAAERMIDDLILLRATQWRELQAQKFRDEAERDGLLTALQESISEWYRQMAELERTAESRLLHLSMQHGTSSRILDLCNKRLAEQAPVRAAGRASHRVVEALVEEHSATQEALTKQLRAVEAQLEEAKRVNMSEEALRLKQQCTKLEHENTTLTRESAKLRSQLSALQQACKATEDDTSSRMVAFANSTREIEDLRRRLGSIDAEHRGTIATLTARCDDSEKHVRKLKQSLQEAQEAQGALQKKSETLQLQLGSLKEKYAQDRTDEVVTRVNVRLAKTADGSASASFPSTDPRDTERLQQQVLLLRRENDALTRRLDSALAEASHAEEQRKQAIERTLALMAQEDAAPKREQALLSTKAEIDKRLKELDEREAALQRRAADVERREAMLSRQKHPGALLTPRAATSTSTTSAAVGPVTSLLGSRQSSAARTPVDSVIQLASVGDSAAKAAAAVRLAPIIHRPLQLVATPSTETAHPQKFSL